ncbi:hypothetical protein AB0K60_09340 [Thermopolyspora sp. NPDC052614]|uniref:hypothetical protein n=1 Tax=Thermopolyspora sp. NPDC052614 TaxID=3155682 RepID=UPI00342F6047
MLDGRKAHVVIEVVTIDGRPAEGRLVAPDDSSRALRFKRWRGGRTWRAEHDFQPGDPPGPWLLEARVGEEVAEALLHVIGRRPAASVWFADDLTVEPATVLEGEPVAVSGRLELVDEDTTLPFGDQLVLLAFRERGTQTWDYVGEARTERDTGRFTAEIGLGTSGEIRAELRFVDGHVDSEAVEVQVLGLIDNVRFIPERPSPVRTTHGGRSCYRFSLKVRRQDTNGFVPSGRVYIQYRPSSGGTWRSAKAHTGRGVAEAQINNGTADVFTYPHTGVGGWRARYRN